MRADELGEGAHGAGGEGRVQLGVERQRGEEVGDVNLERGVQVGIREEGGQSREILSSGFSFSLALPRLVLSCWKVGMDGWTYVGRDEGLASESKWRRL